MRRRILIFVLISFLSIVLHGFGHKHQLSKIQKGEETGCVICDCDTNHPGLKQTPICLAECPCEDEDDIVVASQTPIIRLPISVFLNRGPPQN